VRWYVPPSLRWRDTYDPRLRKALLDRAWGKPRSKIKQDLTVRQPSPADLRPDLSGIRARVIASAASRAEGDNVIN
jgi:hypothetical protein